MATLDLGKVKVTYNGDWDSSKDYEPLCIVNSDWDVKYISIKDVDAGTKLTDTNYWQILSGDWVQQYQGSRSDDPKQRVDGSDLQEGDLYWNEDLKALRFYNGSSWKTYHDMTIVYVDDDYTASQFESIGVDTSDKEITITLPDSPAEYAKIIVFDKEHNASNNNVTVDRNGNKINGKDENLICDKDNFQVTLRFNKDNWILINN